MFEHGLRETWIALLLGLASVAPAWADGNAKAVKTPEPK
jgi:hypothetical protein